MAYAFTNSKGVTYYLHTKKSTTSTGKERTLFYFAKEVKEGTLDSVPEGYKVVEMKTGAPSGTCRASTAMLRRAVSGTPREPGGPPGAAGSSRKKT